MTASRLLVVEGVAGSGKSTLAAHLGDLLGARGVPHRVVQEGDLDHPADFEQVAWLSEVAFADLVGRYPVDAGAMAGVASRSEGGVLIAYGRLRAAGGVSDEVLDELAARDVYELPVDEFRRLTLRRWQEFGAAAAREPDVWVFDCTLLQNPITALMMKHDVEPVVIEEHVRAIIDAIDDLAPVVIYLDPGDVRTALERVIPQRPAGWWDYLVWYHTEQTYGRRRSLHGVDGTVRALEDRRRLEADLLASLPIRSVRVDVGEGWDAARATLAELVG